MKIKSMPSLIFTSIILEEEIRTLTFSTRRLKNKKPSLPEKEHKNSSISIMSTSNII